MEQIPDQIKSFYQQLDEITKFDRWELMKQLKPLTELFEHNWNEVLIIEHLCLRFSLHEGILKHDFTSVDRDGNEIKMPSVDVFSDVQKDYIKRRALEVKNPVLIARYNHILFETEKHRKYAEVAINAYKKLIYLRIEDDTYERLLPSIDAIIKLTEKIKFDVERTKKELIDLLHNNDIEIYNKHYISNAFIKSSLFKSTELKFLPNLAMGWLDELKDKNYFIQKNILNNAIKICVNNRIDAAPFYEKLAENENLMLAEHPDDSDFIKVTAFGDIVEYYKKAKNLEKYEVALKEYSRVKAKTELYLIDATPDKETQRIMNEEIKRHLKVILKWDVDKILHFYSNHSPLFPDIDTLTTSTTKRYNKSFLRHVTSNVFDINNNIKRLDDKSGLENEISRDYQMYFGMMILPEFIQVLQVGAYNRKISYYHVYDYFARNSWYGQNLPETKLREHGAKTTYNWLNLMAPALHSFLIQLETSFLVGPQFTNWVLPIDSLTLKFEGALRDFIRIAHGSTSVLKNDEIREMLLDDLLNCEAAKKAFSPNDLALFKMVFTNKGDNIRHNVAHCFYHDSDYSLVKICKVFLCILRLGRYKLTEKRSDDE
jgi:hypothetical protein